MGTFQYMSPEQLEGKQADARTDIFSLGCVLYEMATGKKAFTGTSQASLISAILRDHPRPISELTPLAPPALERLIADLPDEGPRGSTAKRARREERAVLDRAGRIAGRSAGRRRRQTKKWRAPRSRRGRGSGVSWRPCSESSSSRRRYGRKSRRKRSHGRSCSRRRVSGCLWICEPSPSRRTVGASSTAFRRE